MNKIKSVFAEFEWTCPHCRQETNIFVEVESPSEYYPDTTCEGCGKEIKSSKLDERIIKEAADSLLKD